MADKRDFTLEEQINEILGEEVNHMVDTGRYRITETSFKIKALFKQALAEKDATITKACELLFSFSDECPTPEMGEKCGIYGHCKVEKGTACWREFFEEER